MSLASRLAELSREELADFCQRTGLTLWFGFVALVVSVAPLQAQERVEPISDAASWATAFVNPSIATVKALRSEHAKCELGRLALSEGIESLATFAIKNLVVSPRPCLGCPANGMPSGHSGQSLIGASSWRFGISVGVLTGTLRVQARRHNPWQVAAGIAIGGLSEFAGQKLVKCGS